MYFMGYRLWDRFRDAPWQKLVRAGLAPLTAGLVIAGGSVVARTADISWPAVGVTVTAAALLLFTRLNPLWVLGGAGIFGALGLL
jgi:chromate transporter